MYKRKAESERGDAGETCTSAGEAAKFGQDEWAAGKENMLTVPEDSCLST
jgi:hypothetical protein